MGSRIWKIQRRTSVSALALAAAWGVLGGSAYAQQSSQQDQNSSQQDQVETVVVTGTGTNISGIAPVGSESISMDRTTIQATGFTNLGDVLNTVPQVSSAGAAGGGISTRQGGTSGYGGTGGGADATQTTAINLRGVGAQGTLTLVDGHRIASSGATNIYTEVNQIPLAAIKKIDVLLDGNSAIYGSDAVAGVINLVTRKDFEGLEATARGTWVNGYHEYGASLTGGHVWDHIGPMGGGNIILSFDYDYRSPMLNSSRPYLSQNLSRYGGLDTRIPNGAVNGGIGPGQPSNTANPGPNGLVGYCDVWDAATNTCGGNGVPASYVYFGLPANSNGVGRTTADLTTPTYSDTATATTFLGTQLRYQASGFFSQDITKWLSLYVDAFYTHRVLNNTQSQEGNFGLTVNAVCAPSAAVTCTGFYFPQPYDNPLYIAPPTAPAGSGYNYGGPMYIRYDATAHGNKVLVQNPDENYTIIAGFRVKLPFNWNADVSGTYSRDNTCGECQINTNLSGPAFNYEVDEAAMAMRGDTISSSAPINPLNNSDLTAAQKAEIYGTNIQKTTNAFNDFNLKFDGPLFVLPAGTVSAAVGVEFQYMKEFVQNGANRAVIPAYPTFIGPAFFGVAVTDPVNGIDPLVDQGYGILGSNNDTSGVGCKQLTNYTNCAPRSPNGTFLLNNFGWDNITFSNRHVQSAYFELYVPLVGKGFTLPLVQSFDIDAAVRYDGYSGGVGDTTNPRVAANWNVDDDLKVRGSWGTSFRAPTLADDNPQVFSYKFATPGNITNNVTGLGIPTGPINALLLGGQPSHLTPETAQTWSVGFDYSPHWLTGLTTSLTYYNIAYSNRIAGFPAGTNFLGSAANYALYKNYVTIVHQPASCQPADPSTYDPAFLPGYNTFGLYGAPYYFGVNPCQIQAVIDQRTTNLSTTIQDGVDINVNYALDTEIGSWDFDLNLTPTVHDTLRTVPGAAPQNVLGTVGYPQNWKSRGTISWSDKEAWFASLFINYVGPYKNLGGLNGQTQQMPAWVTVDLNVNYSFDQFSSLFVDFKNARISVSAENVFNQSPPILLTTLGGGYDASAANAFGRIISLQLTKDF